MLSGTSTCGTCGHSWPTGTNGDHSCAAILKAERNAIAIAIMGRANVLDLPGIARAVTVERADAMQQVTALQVELDDLLQFANVRHVCEQRKEIAALKTELAEANRQREALEQLYRNSRLARTKYKQWSEVGFRHYHEETERQIAVAKCPTQQSNPVPVSDISST